MARLIAGLTPRGFTWVIADLLAVSERIGGHGIEHRRVRREEEIAWLVHEAGVTAVVTLLPGNQNLQAYQEAGLRTFQAPVTAPVDGRSRDAVFEIFGQALAPADAKVLVHREIVDDTVAGLVGGYLIASGRLTDPILAVAVIQEILGRPLGPQGRSLVSPP